MRRLLPLLMVIFIIASLLIFCFGDSGLLAYRDLQGYREDLAANVAALELRNKALATELRSVRDDRERAVVLARSIGLYEPGDKVVRLEGVPSRTELYAVGDLLKMRKGGEARNAVVKTAAAAAIGLLLSFSLVMARAARRRAHGSQG